MGWVCDVGTGEDMDEGVVWETDWEGADEGGEGAVESRDDDNERSDELGLS